MAYTSAAGASKGLITRLPRSHRYQLTELGRQVAVLFTKTHARVLTPGLAALQASLPPEVAQRSRLRSAWRQLDRALDHHIDTGLVAA